MIPLALTPNFVYGVPGLFRPTGLGAALPRIAALTATCESDLATLESWFGLSGGFGSNNPVTILIDQQGKVVRYWESVDGNSEIQTAVEQIVKRRS